MTNTSAVVMHFLFGLMLCHKIDVANAATLGSQDQVNTTVGRVFDVESLNEFEACTQDSMYCRWDVESWSCSEASSEVPRWNDLRVFRFDSGSGDGTTSQGSLTGQGLAIDSNNFTSYNMTWPPILARTSCRAVAKSVGRGPDVFNKKCSLTDKMCKRLLTVAASRKQCVEDWGGEAASAETCDIGGREDGLAALLSVNRRAQCCLVTANHAATCEQPAYNRGRFCADLNIVDASKWDAYMKQQIPLFGKDPEKCINNSVARLDSHLCYFGICMANTFLNQAKTHRQNGWRYKPFLNKVEPQMQTCANTWSRKWWARPGATTC